MELETLKKIQKTELGIMIDVAKFCDEHNLRYSLFGGTALGAVRHKGFIPWDDDVDLCMNRVEYEKFLDLWMSTEHEGYYLRDTRGVAETTINHSKVMKLGTIYDDKKNLDKPGCHGVFVDIFPIDVIPVKPFQRYILKFIAAIRLVYTRDYPMKHNGKKLEILSKLMLSLPKSLKNKIRKTSDHYIMRYQNENENVQWIGLSSPEELSVIYPYDMMDELIDVEFEGHTFKMTGHYHEMLTSWYGDYMQLPPVEERVCKHMREVIKV